MRIIAGIARGLPLSTPRGGLTRPTSDRVREALFSSLGERVAGARVLDLFAGTGALGLEAASRGAGSVMFVEKSRRVLAVLENNLQQFKRTAADGPALKVMTAAVTVALRRLARAGTRFDLVFADPPYGTGDGSRELLANDDLPRVLAPTGRLVLETARRDEMTPPAPWVTERGRVYGDTRITMFRATVRTSS